MNCISVQPLVSKLIDGELNPHEEKNVRAHLDGCGACRARYEELEKVGRLMTQSLAAHPFTEEFASRTLNLIPSRRLTAVPRRKPRRILPWIAAAAALLLIVVGLSFIFIGEKESPLANNMPRKPVWEKLDIGTNKLRDGSVIDLWAGGDGEVKYGGNETTVTLKSGTLFAKVVKQTGDKTFNVATKDLTVIVVGTEFYVEIRDAITVCTVKEGEVLCIPADNKKAAFPVSAGQAFDTSKPAKTVSVSAFPKPTASSTAEPVIDPVKPIDVPSGIGEPVPDSADPLGDHSVDPDMPIRNPDKDKKKDK
jgi:ferric-dicitrate binding protein FerR (iron transport regulator)